MNKKDIRQLPISDTDMVKVIPTKRNVDIRYTLKTDNEPAGSLNSVRKESQPVKRLTKETYLDPTTNSVRTYRQKEKQTENESTFYRTKRELNWLILNSFEGKENELFITLTYKEQMQTFRYGVVPFMVVTVIIVGLLMLEPHLSASIIIMTLAIVMMFVGGIKLSYLLVGMGSAGALLLIASKFVPYVHKRIVSWRDPFADTSAAGYQIVQSLYSIGSGGFLGLGLGQSRQKYLYLPEEHNDYIFSIVCEELGYVGAIAILILFALLICRGYWIAAHSPDRYSFLVGVGITTLLSIQVFLNIAVVTNLIPCTGISLPFFSYGGTALLMQLGEMGIILSISRDIPTKKAR